MPTQVTDNADQWRIKSVPRRFVLPISSGITFQYNIQLLSSWPLNCLLAHLNELNESLCTL